MAPSGRVLALFLCGWIGNVCAQRGLPSEAAGAPRGATDDPALVAFPAHPSRGIVIRTCAPCHAPELVVAKRRTVDEWDQIIATMIDRGAVADDDEQARILEYLAQFFGPAPDDSPAPE